MKPSIFSALSPMRPRTAGSSALNPVALGLALLLSFGAVGCTSSSKNKNNGLDENGNAISDQDLSIDKNRFAGGNIPVAAEGQQFPDVHFDYDSAVVRQDDYEVVRSNAKLMAGDPALQMEVEGHCDKRGTAEYNLALGEERAKAVAALLVNYGAKPEQLSTISYGEEIPLDPRDADDAYAKNRRVHFAVYRKKAG